MTVINAPQFYITNTYMFNITVLLTVLMTHVYKFTLTGKSCRSALNY